MAAEERQGGVHRRVLDRPDRRLLPRRGAALLEPGDGGDRLMDAGRHQLLGDRPLEDPLDHGDAAVALGPAAAVVDPPLAGGLDAQRPELGDGLLGVQLAQRPDDDPDLVDLAGVLAVGGAVVPLGVIQVGQEQLGHRQAARLGGPDLVRGGLQFGQQRGECGAGLGAVEGAGQHPELAGAGLVGPDRAGFSGLRVGQVAGDGLAVAGHRWRSPSIL